MVGCRAVLPSQARAGGRRERRRVGARGPDVGGNLLDSGGEAGDGARDSGGDGPLQLAPHEEVSSEQHEQHEHEHEHDGAAVGAGGGSTRREHRVVVGHAALSEAVEHGLVRVRVRVRVSVRVRVRVRVGVGIGVRIRVRVGVG